MLQVNQAKPAEDGLRKVTQESRYFRRLRDPQIYVEKIDVQNYDVEHRTRREKGSGLARKPIINTEK